jgi:pimeloyl-ACP methyl ester carboxylesterase
MAFDESFVRQWTKGIDEDPTSQSSGRAMSAALTLDFGGNRFLFEVHRGKVERVTADPGPLTASQMLLEAEESVWDKLFEPDPPAMFHDIFACIARGTMRFEGDVRVLIRHMQPLADWVQVARAMRGERTLGADVAPLESYQAKGGFVNVNLDGALYKVFYFEAGEGIPVLLQHTAGNENRQWRHLLEDRELTKRFRFIAYDLPGHGKSDPPRGPAFWKEDQLVRSEWLTDFVVAFSEAMSVENPIFMGTSIGGVLALHLAERFPEKFRGIVGMAGAIPTQGFFHDWWIHPEINTPMMVGAITDSVMAPATPEWDRRLTSWFQSANPRNIRNDLYFWGVENADPTRADRIDASKVPLYLYAGEYDYTCPPELVEACAKRIGPEVTFTRSSARLRSAHSRRSSPGLLRSACVRDLRTS